MNSTDYTSVGQIIGRYVDERARMNGQIPATSADAPLSKLDLLRMYTRTARMLRHSQPDQRFHLELIRLSKASDYTPGGSVVLAHSNAFLAQRCGMSRSALGRQLRRHDGSTLRRSLSGNGHRFVARGRSSAGQGTVVAACGISLEPLLALMREMQPIIEAQDELQFALEIEKARIGRDRRRQREATDRLDGDARAGAIALGHESKSLVDAIRAAFAGGRLAELQQLGRKVAEITDRIEALADPDPKPDGRERTSEGCESGHLLPLQKPDSSETVVAAGDDGGGGQDRNRQREASNWTPRAIIACLPSLGMYVGGTSEGDIPSWRMVDAAASRLARDLGVNATCWQRALGEMGPEQRCVAIALVAELLGAGRISTTAGQYFGGMLKRARSGELHLERSVWGFRRKSQAR